MGSGDMDSYPRGGALLRDADDFPPAGELPLETVLGIGVLPGLAVTSVRWGWGQFLALASHFSLRPLGKNPGETVQTCHPSCFDFLCKRD